MHKRTFVGLCAALAFVAGSPGAHALKIFDTAPADRAALTAATANDSFTYASETLLTTEVTEVKDDSTKYYNIGGTGNVILSLPADVGATSGDTYLVSVTLDGMVFRTALTATSLVSSGTTWSVADGGAAGGKSAVFRLLTGTIDAASANLDLSAQLAVSDGGGSATVNLTNQTLAALNIPGVSGTKTHGPANVIKVASALKETPMASNLTASVEASFKKFMDGMTVGHVGSITVGINGHRIATESAGTEIVNGLNDILQTGQTTVGTTTTANSSVSFMGDFSFTSRVFMHGDADCGTVTTGVTTENPDNDGITDEADIRNMEGTGDDAVVTNTTKAVNLDPTPTDATDDDAVASFMSYLCIMVQGDDTDDMEAPRIPDTDAYTAMGSYKALANAASGPMGMERKLGEINRDGTTVQLPYLTTNERFNQRIRIVNRGAETEYFMDFQEGDMEGDMAEGTLGANSVMSFTTGEAVTPGSGNTTSGTLTVEAKSSAIDVVTVQINRMDGSSDTVVYQAD